MELTVYSFYVIKKCLNDVLCTNLNKSSYFLSVKSNLLCHESSENWFFLINCGTDIHVSGMHKYFNYQLYL